VHTSPHFWTSLVNYWQSLRDGTRDGIISGLIVTLVVGIGVSFRDALIAGIRRFFKDAPPAQPPQIQQQPPPLPPQRVIVELDTTRLTTPPPPEPLKAELPKVAPPAPSPDFLRPPAFGFVARRDEQGQDIIERLKKELAPGRNQLVTLSGKGGVGKTTLAREAFRVLGETYEGHLVWSDATARAGYTLATLLDDATTQLGRAELRALAPEAKETTVRSLFVEHPALVALDNYETIDKAEQERIEHWLAHTQCSSLTTSRQKIKDTLNIVIPTMTPDEAQEFLEKRIAQTQEPQLFTPEVRQRIYETAEGNPFLMEWVVAQVDDAQESDAVLEELKHGEGDAAERVFGRSFNLPQVGEDGRAALLALSLFVPSASRPALAAVAGFGDDEKRLSEAMKSLHALWLVKGLEGNSRFTVEGLTRSLTSARLSKVGREDEFRQRFIAYFLQYAEAHNKETPEDYDALEAERDNLLSATDAAFEREDWISVERMAYALATPPSGMLYVRGYWAEALRINEIALKAARSAQDEANVAGLTHSVAMMYGERGERNEARKLYDESLEINKRLGNQSIVAATLHELGRLTQGQGELDEARRLYDESLEINKQLGNQNGIAITLHQLGWLAQDQGNLAEARKFYDESLEINKQLGNQSGIAITLHQLGRLAQKQGDLSEARKLYNESLEINKRLGNQSGVAATLDGLGIIEKIEGNEAEAVRLMSESLSIFERLGSPTAELVRGHLEWAKGKT
jgi:tetratricopeptide (TPR) repeat protein